MPPSPALFFVAFAATVNGLLAPPTANTQRPWGRKSKRLRHAVGTSPEKPPAFKDWPSPCHNNLCPCRASPSSPPTWISYWCHHTGVPLNLAKQAPCQDGRSCNGRGTCAVGAHCIADGNPTEMGLALTCSRCNYLAHGREFLNTTDDKGWLRIPDIDAIFFDVGGGQRVYQFWDSRLIKLGWYGTGGAPASALEPPTGLVCDYRLQLEAQRQWLEVEEQRRAAYRAHQALQGPSAVALAKAEAANAICVKCGFLRTLSKVQLDLLAELGGQHGRHTGRLARTGRKPPQKPRCRRRRNGHHRCGAKLRVLSTSQTSANAELQREPE